MINFLNIFNDFFQNLVSLDAYYNFININLNYLLNFSLTNFPISIDEIGLKNNLTSDLLNSDKIIFIINETENFDFLKNQNFSVLSIENRQNITNCLLTNNNIPIPSNKNLPTNSDFKEFIDLLHYEKGLYYSKLIIEREKELENLQSGFEFKINLLRNQYYQCLINLEEYLTEFSKNEGFGFIKELIFRLVFNFIQNFILFSKNIVHIDFIKLYIINYILNNSDLLYSHNQLPLDFYVNNIMSHDQILLPLSDKNTFNFFESKTLNVFLFDSKIFISNKINPNYTIQLFIKIENLIKNFDYILASNMN